MQVLSTNGYTQLGPQHSPGYRIGTCTLRQLCLLRWVLGLCLVGVPSNLGLTQETTQQAEPPLIDQQPFDLITLNAANGGASVKVFPIPFPERSLPASPSPQDKLRVVLVRFPEREYEVLWRDIARVELYEQRIYDEAQRKLIEKDFIGAFQNLSFLLKKYPQLPRLEELRQEFLLKSAADRFQAGEFRQTLSALEELRATAPNFQASTVIRVLSQVAEGLIKEYQQAGDLASAQQLLKRLRTTYGPTLPAVASWENKLQEMAEAKQAEAIELLSRQEYRRARQAATAMLSILPDAQQAQEIIQQINREHPMVRVGVMQRSYELDATSLVNWGARRAGMLVQQPIFQFLETGAEGGRYGFALGTHRASDDRQQLILSLDPNVSQPLGAFGLAQLLLARSDPNHPDYDPTWAAIFRAVSIPTAHQVLVQLRRPNVLPHALLQWTVADDLSHVSDSQPADMLQSPAPLLPGPYQLESQDDQQASFVSRQPTQPAGQPREVIELFYEDPKLAVNDLLRGDIDLLDQLYPADAQRLSSDPRLTVGTYALPTTHMLIPLSDDPFLANVKFRRALLYATNRQGVLTGELLSSSDPMDGRLISGPFPLGGGVNDPLSYAYNKSIQPVEFNPQLAKLLLAMTQQELREQAKRTRQPEPKLRKLIVGCPDYELARVAVQAMIQQWANVGIEAEILIQSMEEAFIQKCDLIYVTTTMWEPATDIQRLLGGNGVAATENPFIVQALESLLAARNWREVRTALQDLHQLIDYHLPVLPLWQISDRFAVRKYVNGVENRPVSLYQNVTEWRVDFGQLQITAK